MPQIVSFDGWVVAYQWVCFVMWLCSLFVLLQLSANCALYIIYIVAHKTGIDHGKLPHIWNKYVGLACRYTWNGHMHSICLWKNSIYLLSTWLLFCVAVTRSQFLLFYFLMRQPHYHYCYKQHVIKQAYWSLIFGDWWMLSKTMLRL